jgi:hypothetical protein
LFPYRILYLQDALQAAHYGLPSVGVIGLSLLYWRVDRGQFRCDRVAILGAVGWAVVWMLGVIGSGWCYSRHICMDGHMAHPPYPWWQYGVDIGWVVCLGTASVGTRLLRASLCIAFSGIAAFLISYRFIFKSFGGMYDWLPL